MNIIEFYNKSNNNRIGYLHGDFDLTDNINHAMKYGKETDLIPLINSILIRIYKTDWDSETQSVSKHTYGHLYKDWFKGIVKSDVCYRIHDFEMELRRLKLERIKKRRFI